MPVEENPYIEAAVEEERRKAAELQRDVAVNVAAREMLNRDAAESAAVEARIAAGQSAKAASELATERNLLHDDLTVERHISANNAFGFYLMTGVLVAIAAVAGLWFYFQNQNAANVRNSTSVVSYAPNTATNASVPVSPSRSAATNARPVVTIVHVPVAAPGTNGPSSPKAPVSSKHDSFSNPPPVVQPAGGADSATPKQTTDPNTDNTNPTK